MPRPTWKFGFMTAVMALATGSAFAAKPAPVKDFSRSVEVVPAGRLRETKPGQGELALSVWNKTDEAIAGPIYVVIDDTGLEQVKVGSHVEETAAGKPVFEVVPLGKELLAGAMTPSLPLAFRIPDGLSREEADKVHLATRVFGREAPADEAKLARARQAREDADFATRGKSYNQADLDAAIAVQEKITPAFLAKPNVLGTAITEDAKGNLAIRVYTETRAAAKALPGSVEKYGVDVQPVPGGFKGGPARNTLTSLNGVTQSKKSREAASKAAAGPNASGRAVVPVDPTLRFDRPVPIGVSSFNADTPICASGTLGFRVKDSSGKLYAVSNSHVWGDQGAATVGQTIVQPSQGESLTCDAAVSTNTIGFLVDFTAYINDDPMSTFFTPNSQPMNFIDAALMEVVMTTDAAGATVPGVGFATPSDGYGAPSSNVLRTNRIGLPVQKYGRTTGYTRGKTTAVNIMSQIGGNTAADTTSFYRIDEFIGILQNVNFGQPGDSGSLIVTMDRRPVAHLFAGGPGATGVDLTLGNRIGMVLDRFNVQVDDGSDPNVTTTGTGTSGLGGREGIALGNITGKDLQDFTVTDANGLVLGGLLPAELVGRVKPNLRPLNPTQNGFF